jgi:hypothetical protein
VPNINRTFTARRMDQVNKYKYKINEYLYGLNVYEYAAARKIIPRELDISSNTFHNYRSIKLGSATDIPYEIIRKMEILFNMKRGGLENSVITGKKLKTLIYEDQGS